MNSPYFIAFIKMLSGLLALVVAALAKWSKDRYERKSIKKGVEINIKKYNTDKRQLYQDDVDKFMNSDHPQKVFFIEELIVNAYRPILILVAVSIFTYNNYYFQTFVLIIALAYPFIEFNMDDLKENKWFIGSLFLIWIVSLFLIIYSEKRVHESDGIFKNEVNLHITKDTTNK